MIEPMSESVVYRSSHTHRIARIGIAAISAPVILAALYIIAFDPRPEFFVALVIYAATTLIWAFPWLMPLRSKLIVSQTGVTVVNSPGQEFIPWAEIAEFTLDGTQTQRFEAARAELVRVNGVRVRISAIESPPATKPERRAEAETMIKELNVLVRGQQGGSA